MDYSDPHAIWTNITQCKQHPVCRPDDCEHCANEITARSAVIDQMGAEAQDRLQGIAKQGGPQMPPYVVLEARLEVLIDSILNTNPRQRMEFEGEVGRRVLLQIKSMQEQVKQPSLHVAKTMPTNVRDLKRS